MGDLGVLAEFAIARLCGPFWSCRLRQKLVRCWFFKGKLMSRSDHLRRDVFQAPEVGQRFGSVFPGLPFAKSQKMGDFGVLAEFAIARRLWGHFWSRRLQQKLFRC